MTTEAERAVANSFRLEAKKDALRQTQDGLWKVTLTVQASDMPPGLLQAAMGTRYMIAACELADDETAVEQPVEALETPIDPEGQAASLDAAWTAAKGGPRSQECGRFCGDPGFRAFVRETQLTDDTAQAVRELCGIESRRELDTDDDAWRRWCGLMSDYTVWRDAQQR